MDPVTFSDEKNFRWSVKRVKFCYWMARLGVATEAAAKAGIHESTATELMQREQIQAKIADELRNLLRAQCENEDTVLARWSLWANVDPGLFFDKGWELKDISELSEDARKCIKKVKLTENQFGRNVDLEFHDAHRANNDLANVLGMLHREGESEDPEDTARNIADMLKEMREKDGLQEPPLESREGQKPHRTH